VRSIDLRVDVTEAAGLGEPAHVAVTVTAPDELPTGGPPIVCFAKPGAGYSRGYFTEALPGPAPGSAAGAQADWHAARGWIVVSVDHLGVGESSQHDAERLAYTPVAAASQAAETEVRQKLAAGTLMDGLAPVRDPITIGIGQSMGGALTIVQQGRFHCYDGIGVLGYSPLRTHPPAEPGTAPVGLPWLGRDTMPSDGVFTNGFALALSLESAGEHTGTMAWGFHYDDIAPELVSRDMEGYPLRGGDMPGWGSAGIPMTVALWSVTPGGALAEAAAVRTPVLVALGERDVLVDPRGETRAYESSPSVDFFVCPRMAHMHNFAGTRELFWRRIETWADWVRDWTAAETAKV
jgi:hypothetical protein